MGLFDRLKERLTRTREALSDNIAKIFKGGRAIDRALLDELEAVLYQGDLGPIAGEVMAEINRLHERGEIKGEDEVRAVLREVLLGFVAPAGVKPGTRLMTVALCGHADEIGLMVNHFDSNGYIYCRSIGGIDAGSIVGKRIQFTSSVPGVKNPVLGVIGATARFTGGSSKCRQVAQAITPVSTIRFDDTVSLERPVVPPVAPWKPCASSGMRSSSGASETLPSQVSRLGPPRCMDTLPSAP